MLWLRERVLEGSLMVWDRIALIGRLGISAMHLALVLWDAGTARFNYLLWDDYQDIDVTLE